MDRCPYRRPMPPGFDECPAYQRTDAVIADSMDNSLGIVITCGHLQAGERTEAWFYPQCRIGDEQARLRWVARVDADRVALARHLQVEIAERFNSRSLAVWEAKRLHLKARAAGDTREEARLERALVDAVRVLLTDMEAYFEERTADLERLHIPLALCVELFQRIAEDWVAMPTLDLPPLPADVLERFPPVGRLLVDPSAETL